MTYKLSLVPIEEGWEWAIVRDDTGFPVEQSGERFSLMKDALRRGQEALQEWEALT